MGAEGGRHGPPVTSHAAQAPGLQAGPALGLTRGPAGGPVGQALSVGPAGGVLQAGPALSQGGTGGLPGVRSS